MLLGSLKALYPYPQTLCVFVCVSLQGLSHASAADLVQLLSQIGKQGVAVDPIRIDAIQDALVDKGLGQVGL